MKTLRKLAIMESLDAMDQTQMDKVMTYIRDVLRQESRKVNRIPRQQAMEQIRKALHPQQIFQPPF